MTTLLMRQRRIYTICRMLLKNPNRKKKKSAELNRRNLANILECKTIVGRVTARLDAVIPELVNAQWTIKMAIKW